MTPSRFLHLARRFGFARRSAVILFLFQFFGTVFEGIGLSMLLPVFQYIQAGGDLVALTAGSSLWQRLIDGFAWLGLPVTLISLLSFSFACILVRQLFMYARLVYTAKVQQGITFQVRNRIFQKYLNVRASYVDQQRVGEIVNNMTIELLRAASTIVGSVALLGHVAQVLFYGAILFVVSPPMTLTVLGVVMLVVVMSRRLMHLTAKTGAESTSANKEASQFLVERLMALRLVRLSGTEAAERAAMRALTQRQRDRLVKVTELIARVQVMFEPVFAAIGLVLLYVGVTHFDMMIERIGLFLVIVIRLLPVIKEIVGTYQGILGLRAGADSVEQCLDGLDAERETDGGSRRFEGLVDGIRFENVTFDYAGGDGIPALNNVHLALPVGSFTALVGPSGAGKSTLIDMLPRLREPTSGTITLDGVPIADYTLASLRASIAYLPQEPQIFNVTPAEHIGFGRESADAAAVHEAARQAGADDFIRALPQGYDTPLGEHGGRLSGGQRQRLDLARALVRAAPILIFDEPTSNLDADAEQLFRDTLARLRTETGATIIVVGHRLSTVSGADQIVVLRDGHVTELGSHSELLARGGWYATAWSRQTLDDEQPAREAGSA